MEKENYAPGSPQYVRQVWATSDTIWLTAIYNVSNPDRMIWNVNKRGNDDVGSGFQRHIYTAGGLPLSNYAYDVSLGFGWDCRGILGHLYRGCLDTDQNCRTRDAYACYHINTQRYTAPIFSIQFSPTIPFYDTSKYISCKYDKSSSLYNLIVVCSNSKCDIYLISNSTANSFTIGVNSEPTSINLWPEEDLSKHTNVRFTVIPCTFGIIQDRGPPVFFFDDGLFTYVQFNQELPLEFRGDQTYDGNIMGGIKNVYVSRNSTSLIEVLNSAPGKFINYNYNMDSDRLVLATNRELQFLNLNGQKVDISGNSRIIQDKNISFPISEIKIIK